jgi:hypothetical protein
MTGAWLARFSVCGAFLLAAGVASSGAEAQPAPAPSSDAAKPLTIWEPLVLPSSPRSAGSTFGGDEINDMATEPNGTLWVMGNHSLFCWTGVEFKQPAGKALRSGMYLTGLFGGRDRDLFATQVDSVKSHRGDLYRLRDGQATRVAEFRFDVGHDDPGLYVAKTGQVINWGQAFVAALNGDAWTRIEAKLNRQRVVVLETNSAVHLISERQIYTVDRRGEIRGRELAAPAGVEFRSGVVWGDDRALLLDDRNYQLTAYDLTTLVKDSRRFQLVKPAVPDRVGALWRGNISARSEEGPSIPAPLFWRVDSGRWVRGSDPGRIEISFSAAGRHDVQVIGIGPQAELTEPIDVTFDVEIGDK